MSELLPEFLSVRMEEGEAKKPPPKHPKQVTDFHTWLQCFASYCSVLENQHPSEIPELMVRIFQGWPW